MNRRELLAGAGGTVASGMAANAAETKPAIFELVKLRMRNTQDSMVQRANEYVAKGFLPALQRAGGGPAGAFTSLIAPDSPFLLLVLQFAGLADWEAVQSKLSADKEYQRARESWFAGPLQYVRTEVSLLRGFRTMPVIEVPPPLSEKRSRVFELRTYESNNSGSLAKKIRMFDEGEIGLFRKLGILPVFFGETLAGQNMPNLTYMVAYDDLAAREKAWSAFGASPEWQKMRSQPGLSDGEIVSNISNILVRPLPFSAIR